ncbi:MULTISPECIES: glycoside hydrolase family 43 protein [Sphingobium]|jgi:GH43 family beta-xylosidase|uniref:Glycosyl hydrolase family 43 n=1 Tax=Sphingobium fuliginis (strain ATCC 27551) TaxID=336203 RepID=A0ABQ1F3E8_SPHSA|nr:MULTISPECIES: glycoside hydrolase family 43 protein [Sphingobium]MCB4861843.1 glycoside hydrolase family 43 protein [Sphingobium sp. PNB]PNQ01691.1 alpha-N-arabinofuranosidase [Sphingobium sp. SA916]RYL96868.1 alpha-N-arabinofuranosidase [Sphingobium fuliginis]UXC93303.1 glycoside hydrolase family 43 protein [Sphingobium sp. RSMS]WDA35900.1 glycoside hydrolase family 43 protein [Sphingobium sp. YC-XJ3]
MIRAFAPLTLAPLTLAALLALGGCATASTQQAAPTLANPLLSSGPDPWIVHHGATFYFLGTKGDRIAIRQTDDLAKLADAPEHVIWTPPASGPNAISIWAPELHRLDGKWYVYYTAAEAGHDDDAHRGVFVLENANADPLKGEWIDRGRVNTRMTGLDGTVFEHGGKRYFVYSAYDGPDSVLAIAPMTNAWTLGPGETVIARPDQPFERQGGRQILEGPEFLPGPKGDLFLTYSASACWSDDYALGLLHARPGSDPMNPASWTKAPRPVLAKAPQNNVYATGHNGFFTTDGGRQTWIVYHANDGADRKCTAARSPRVQRMEWSRDGMPIFPVPSRAGEAVAAPKP